MSFRDQYNPWSIARISQLSYSYAAAVLLAIDHFNARDAAVVPELEDLKRIECTIHFPEPTFVDSGRDRAVIFRALRDIMEAGRPVCAVLAPLQDDDVLSGLLPVLEALDIPLLVHSVESDALARGEERNIAALLSLSAAGRARAMVEYLSRRKYLADWHLPLNQETLLAEAIQAIGRDQFDLQTFLFADKPATPGTDEEEFQRQKLERMKSSGVTTIFLAIRQPYQLLALAALLEDLDMLSADYIYVLSHFLVPVRDDNAIFGLYGEQRPGSPLDKLLSGAIVFDRLDGFDFRKENEDPFWESWKRQNATQVDRLNALVPVSWLNADPDYFQVVKPSEGASFVYDSVIALGLGACAKQHLDHDFIGGEHRIPEPDGPPPGFEIPDGLLLVASREQEATEPSIVPTEAPVPPVSMNDTVTDDSTLRAENGTDVVTPGNGSGMPVAGNIPTTVTVQPFTSPASLPSLPSTTVEPTVNGEPTSLPPTPRAAELPSTSQPILNDEPTGLPPSPEPFKSPTIPAPILDDEPTPDSHTDIPIYSPNTSPTMGSSATPKSSKAPNNNHSYKPDVSPSASPSTDLSNGPTRIPSIGYSQPPSAAQSTIPSSAPTVTHSNIPSFESSTEPSNARTLIMYSDNPSLEPSIQPSHSPTPETKLPSGVTGAVLSNAPTVMHSHNPSAAQSIAPSTEPMVMHSEAPSVEQSRSPSSMPSSVPSDSPTLMHSKVPSIDPSSSPSSMPSSVPSDSPTLMHSRSHPLNRAVLHPACPALFPVIHQQ